MAIRTELSLRLPNSPGALAGVCRLLSDERVDILAMSLDGGGQLRMVVDDAGTAVPELVAWAGSNGLEVRAIEKFEAPLDDVFVEIVKQEQNDQKEPREQSRG